jgi:hypothetical protein
MSAARSGLRTRTADRTTHWPAELEVSTPADAPADI